MPGEGLTHGPPAEKKLAAVTTGSAESSGIPCAMVLTLIARSPWGPGFLAPIAALTSSVQLGLSVGRPGPHAFAVRDVIARLAKPPRPSHPRLTCRDDRDTPSSSRRDSADEITDLGSRSREILKISSAVLRHVGTTGSLRMARMRRLPVVQSAIAPLGLACPGRRN